MIINYYYFFFQFRKTVVRKRTVKAILNCNKSPSKPNGHEERPVRHRSNQRIPVVENKPSVKVKEENEEHLQKSENQQSKEKNVLVIANSQKREKQEPIAPIPGMTTAQPQVQIQPISNSVMNRGMPVVPNNPAMYFPYPVYAMGAMYPFNMPIVPSSYTLPVSPFLQQAAGTNGTQNSTQPCSDEGPNSVKMKNDISHSRPSVIQHTPSSVTSLPVSNNGPVVVTTLSSHPSVPRHQSQNGISNKSSALPYNQDRSPETLSHNDQNEQQSFPSSLFPHTLKRQRVEDVLNPNKVLCKSLDMNTKQKMRKKSSSHLAEPLEQPKDLSMKTMRLLESKINNNIVKKISDSIIAHDIPQDLSYKSLNNVMQEQNKKILPRAPSLPSCSSEIPHRQKAPLCSISSLANTVTPMAANLPSSSPSPYPVILPSKTSEVPEVMNSEIIKVSFNFS